MTEIEKRESILENYTAAIVRNRTAFHEQELRAEQFKRQESRMKDMQKSANDLHKRIKRTKSLKEKKRLRGVLDKRIDEINSAKANEILYKPNPALDIEKSMIDRKDGDMAKMQNDLYDNKIFEATYQKMVKDVSNGKPAGLAMFDGEQKHLGDRKGFKEYLGRNHPEQLDSLQKSMNQWLQTGEHTKKVSHVDELEKMRKNQKSMADVKEMKKKEQSQNRYQER